MKASIAWIYLENVKINASAITIFVLTIRINKGIFSIWNLRIVTKCYSACFLFSYFREKFNKVLKKSFSKSLMNKLATCGQCVKKIAITELRQKQYFGERPQDYSVGR